MLSDMVCGGAFHRHIITIGGVMAMLARAGQPAAESTLPMMPAINAADTQRVARPALTDTSCMPEAYAAVANSAVPKCTRAPRQSTRAPQPISRDLQARAHARDPCAQTHRLR